MHRITRLLPVLAVTALAAAQGPNPTSPSGLATTEGNRRFVHFSDAAGGARRFQQVDQTAVGNAWTIRSIGFRRDGTSIGGGSNEPPRTMMLEISCGAIDMAVLSSDYDRNFAPGTRVQVFTPKQVSMPDWTGLNGSPSPFDFVVPFDAAYPYPGSLPLVIDFEYHNLTYTGSTTTLGGSWVDQQYDRATTVQGTAIGAGCVASGGARAFEHIAWLENNGPGLREYGMRLRIDGNYGPPNAPVVVHVDAADPNLAIAGACSRVHAMPLVAFVAGLTDSAGDLPRTSYSFPFRANLVGATLHTQMIALDNGQPGLPVALSNGRGTTMPAYSGYPGTQAAYMWTALPTSLDNTYFFGGGLVIELGL